LLEAAVAAKVKRIIHISALGIENEDVTDYSKTKKLFDSHLMAHSEIDWVILRPSLIYGTNSYGGTSLLRANASLPFIIPLIGEGEQRFQPIHMDDLNKIILFCIEYKEDIRKLYHVVGPEVIAVKDILQGFRRQMGLEKAGFIKIPEKLVYLIATIAGKISSGSLSPTSYRLMQNPEIGVFQDIVDFTSVVPRSFQKGIDTTPLTAQSLWHARLSILAPLLAWSIAVFWVLSGMISLMTPPLAIPALMSSTLLSAIGNTVLFYSFALIDIILGLLFLTKSYKKLSNILQIILICFYTASLTIIKPILWLDPFGILLKNIPLVLLLLVTLAMEERR
jgi:hypothetical protein